MKRLQEFEESSTYLPALLCNHHKTTL